MAISVANSNTYQSGSGGYTNVHTMSGFDCSGTDTCLLVFDFEANPNTNVAGVTADGNAMTEFGEIINTNVSAITGYYYFINNASFNIVVSTPSYKLDHFAAIALENVDQTGSPIVETVTPSAGFGTSITSSITSTTDNLSVAVVSLKSDYAMTPSGTGLTEVVDFAHADSTRGQAFVGTVAGTGASQTLGASWSTNDNCVLMLVEVEGTTGGGDDHTLEPADITLSLTTDGATINQNHVISTNDISLSLSSDATTISQNHVIATNDISLSLTSDATTINQNHVIAPNDISLSLSSDATTINQNHVIAPEDISLTLSEDATTINQNHVIAPNDISLSLTTDNTTIDLSVQLFPADISLSLTTDNTTISQNHNITTQDIALTLRTDLTTLSGLEESWSAGTDGSSGAWSSGGSPTSGSYSSATEPSGSWSAGTNPDTGAYSGGSETSGAWTPSSE